MKAIPFTGVSVRMITHVLAQVIEGLCILHDSAGSLGQGQEFIERCFRSMSPSGMWCALKAVRNSSHVTT
jgi:hypothetical protein